MFIIQNLDVLITAGVSSCNEATVISPKAYSSAFDLIEQNQTNKALVSKEHAEGSVLMPLRSVKESLNEVTFHVMESGFHETNHELKRHLNMQGFSG